jgi:hypothetical protein
MDTSVFTSKDIVPDDNMLSESLGDLYAVWLEIRAYVFRVYPKATEDWSYPGPKYGWGYRIRDKKRAIVYLLPREKFFLVALVYGEKAARQAMESDISPEIRNTIESAKVYAEGRGFRLEVRGNTLVADIKKLIDIKIAN